MTCIAWKDGIIAADSRATWQTGDFELCQKLYKVPRGPNKGHILGTQGATSSGMAFVEWYMNPKKEKPAIQFEDEYFTIVVVRPEGVFTFDDHLVQLPCLHKFYAVGSGAPYAMGAMERGASAIQAVRVACKWNAFCGGPVKWMEYKQRTMVSR